MVVLATRGHVWPSQKAHQEPYPEGLAIYCASYYGLHVVCDGRGPTAGSALVGRAMPRRANENPAKAKQTVDQTCQEPVTDSGGGAALATASRESSRQSGNRADMESGGLETWDTIPEGGPESACMYNTRRQLSSRGDAAVIESRCADTKKRTTWPSNQVIVLEEEALGVPHRGPFSPSPSTPLFMRECKD